MKNKKNSRRFQIFTTILILIVILMSQCICIIYHSVLDGNNPSYAVFSSVVSILSILSAFYFLYFITMNTMKDSRQKAELLILEKRSECDSYKVPPGNPYHAAKYERETPYI